jgi:hypothetical protein
LKIDKHSSLLFSSIGIHRIKIVFVYLIYKILLMYRKWTYLNFDIWSILTLSPLFRRKHWKFLKIDKHSSLLYRSIGIYRIKTLVYLIYKQLLMYRKLTFLIFNNRLILTLSPLSEELIENSCQLKNTPAYYSVASASKLFLFI